MLHGKVSLARGRPKWPLYENISSAKIGSLDAVCGANLSVRTKARPALRSHRPSKRARARVLRRV